MVDKDLPYFNKYLEEIYQCNTGKTCQGVSKLVQSLGKLNIYLLLNYKYVSGANKIAQEVSLHPPHLIDSRGALTPAALIPFCAYQTNMTIMGMTSHGLNFTACSNFRPTVLAGQLCYSLDLSAIKGIKETKVGSKFGLMMVMDPGKVDHEDNEEKELLQGSEIVCLDLEPSSAATSSAKIYLNTLESFTDFRAGTYALSVLKKMTGTRVSSIWLKNPAS